MPFDAWLLLLVAVGLGLTLELTFYRARRRERAGGTSVGSKGPDAGNAGGDA